MRGRSVRGRAKDESGDDRSAVCSINWRRAGDGSGFYRWLAHVERIRQMFLAGYWWITENALGFVLALDGGRHDLIEGGLHAVELELTHEVEQLSTPH